MNRQVCVGLLISLGLHAAVAGLWRARQPGEAGSAATAGPVHRMEVRLLAGSPAVRTEAQPAPVDMPALPATPVRSSAAVPPRAERTGRQIVAQPVPELDADGLGLPVIQERPYLPSKQLDQPPQPAAPIVVPFPDAPLDSARVTGVLVLFIGESGRVDRIEVDESGLPPAFEKAAIETFLQARMQPGIKDGKPSRARMKIEVEFEAR